MDARARAFNGNGMIIRDQRDVRAIGTNSMNSLGGIMVVDIALKFILDSR